MSREQTNKTGAIACIIIAAHLMKKPCVVVSKDSLQNIQGMAKKLSKFLDLHNLDLETQFLDGTVAAWQKLQDTGRKKTNFRK